MCLRVRGGLTGYKEITIIHVLNAEIFHWLVSGLTHSNVQIPVLIADANAGRGKEVQIVSFKLQAVLPFL